MNLLKQLLTNNDCYKASVKLTPKGVMWHSTGANNPNLKRYVQPDNGKIGANTNGNHWNQPKPGGRNVCVHAFIGKLKDGTVATCQTLPWDMRGWHAGKGSSGKTANDTHIGFEICEDGLNNKTYFDAVYKEACELTAYICKQYKLDPMKDGVVICHCEGYSRGVASNHADVMHWFKKYGKSMDNVRKDVKALMSTSAAATTKPSNTTAASDTLYKAQCGAYLYVENANILANTLKKDGYTTSVVKANGTYRVQCGAFKNKASATALVDKLKKAGYNAYVISSTPAVSTNTTAIKKGDKVKVKKGAKSYDGKSVASFIYNNVYTVDSLSGNRAVLGAKSICTPFNVKDLTKV